MLQVLLSAWQTGSFGLVPSFCRPHPIPFSTPTQNFSLQVFSHKPRSVRFYSLLDPRPPPPSADRADLSGFSPWVFSCCPQNFCSPQSTRGKLVSPEDVLTLLSLSLLSHLSPTAFNSTFISNSFPHLTASPDEAYKVHSLYISFPFGPFNPAF